MPRIPAVSRIDAEPAAKAEIVGMLALLESDSRVRLVSDDGSERVLPPQMKVILRRAGEIMGQGHDVDVLDASSETLTPNEAADLIGISRPTLLKLIDEGVLTATNVPGSSHRRLDRLEVEAFRDSRLQMQSGLNAAAAEARATGLFTRLPRKARARNARE
jgi:excisionase family DNA binding protein